jgi:hypothetical protein
MSSTLKRPHHPRVDEWLLDHLISTQQQRRRDGEAEGRGGLRWSTHAAIGSQQNRLGNGGADRRRRKGR